MENEKKKNNGMNQKDKKVKKYYVKGIIDLKSPLIMGSGETENSECDIIRDWEGKVFIPGTSIAGAVRSYLSEFFSEKKLINMVFGETETTKSGTTYQSIIIFHDAFLVGDSKPIITIRDGIKVDLFKKVTEEKKKFDFEVLEPTVKFEFRLELNIYEKHRNTQEKNNEKEKKIEKLFFEILDAFEKGRIKLGAKTYRGFGDVIISENDIEILKLDLTEKEDVWRWLDFEWFNFQKNMDFKTFSEEISKLNIDLATNKTLTKIKVYFDIPYSLLIRQYSYKIGDEADVIALEANYEGQVKQIIPGTSWTGALRTAIYNVFFNHKDNYKIVEGIINELFGYVDENNSDAQASHLRIYESVIEGNETINYTRNQVDRFTGGTVERSLFTEGISFKGEVELRLDVENAEEHKMGLLFLAISELWNGLQPIGGTTSVGRGILQGKRIEITLPDEETIIINDPIKSDKIQESFDELAIYLEGKK